MNDKQWAGVDEIPGVGKVTWSMRIVDDGTGLSCVFNRASLAGGDLTDDQLDRVRAFLQVP